MKRMVAYARVSTDSSDQKNSLESQKQYFEEFIKKSEEYEFCGLYYDEGRSGTRTKQRDGFNKMIEDAKNKKFDMIITKEVSRFARNTVDTLMYTRELKKIGVGVIFTSESINTLDENDEFTLTIMAGVAQKESQKISDRVKWGHKRRQENGRYIGAKIFGYDYINKKLVVNEEEARIVKHIFEMYIEGNGLNAICKELNEVYKVPTKYGNKWRNGTLTRLLENEKYVGTLINGKYEVTDFLEGTVEKTTEDNWCVFENNHQAIISEELWKAVQEEKNNRNKHKKHAKKYSNRYVFSGIIECPHCNSSYTRKIANSKTNPTPIWSCRQYVHGGRKACVSYNYREHFLDKGIKLVIHELMHTKDTSLKYIKEALNVVLEDNTYQKDINEINTKVCKLKQRLKSYQIMRADDELTKAEYNELVEETRIKIGETEKLLNKYINIDQEINTKVQRLIKIEQIINEVSFDIEEPLEEYIFNCFIEKIVPVNNNEYIIKTSMGKDYSVYKDKFRIDDINDYTVFVSEIAEDDECIFLFNQQGRFLVDNIDIYFGILSDKYFYKVQQLASKGSGNKNEPIQRSNQMFSLQ